jgi:protein involved in polysaccharide export with SLBB domain
MRAGAYPLLPNMTVLQALSNSVGSRNGERVYLLRTEAGKQVKHPFNYKDAVSVKKREQNILLPRGRNRGSVKDCMT